VQSVHYNTENIDSAAVLPIPTMHTQPGCDAQAHCVAQAALATPRLHTQQQHAHLLAVHTRKCNTCAPQRQRTARSQALSTHTHRHAGQRLPPSPAQAMHTPTRHNLGCAPCVGLPSRPTRPRRWAATLPTKSTTHTIQLDRAVGTPPPASPPLPAPPTHRCYTCSTCTCSSAKHTRVERRRTLGTAPATRAARSHSVLHNAACSRRARTTGCHPDACPGHPTAVVLQQRCTRGPRQATFAWCSARWLRMQQKNVPASCGRAKKNERRAQSRASPLPAAARTARAPPHP
jgi:hypothetical protein